MIQLIAAPIVEVANETALIVDYKLRAANQRQPPRGRIAKELVADTAENAGNDFSLHSSKPRRPSNRTQVCAMTVLAAISIYADADCPAF